MLKKKRALRAELEEIKIQLSEQGCRTILDAIKRDEHAFVRLVDIGLELGCLFSEDVLEIARHMKQCTQDIC